MAFSFSLAYCHYEYIKIHFYFDSQSLLVLKKYFVFLWKINSVLLNNRGRHCQYNFYRIIYETILNQWITASWKWKWRKLVFSMNFHGICDKIQSLDNITQKISSSWFFPPSVFFFISIIWIGLWFPRKLRK